MPVRYELKKIFRLPLIAAVVAAILSGALVSFRSSDPVKMHDMTEGFYIEYLKNLEGPLTEKKERYILNEQEFIADTLAAADEKEKEYLRGDITKETYEAYLKDLTYCRERSEAFDRLFADYQYIKESQTESPGLPAPEFLYREYWNRLFSPYRVDFVLVILMLFFTVVMAAVENDCDMPPLLYSSQRGRIDTLAAKLKLETGAAVLLSLVFSALRIWIFYKRAYLPDTGAPVQSLEYFTGFPFKLSLTQLLITGMFCKAAVFALFFCICLLSGYFIKKKITITAAYAGVLFVPLFVSNLLPAVYAYMPPAFLNFFYILYFSSQRGNMPLKIICMASVAALYIFLFAALLCRAERQLRV